jgi:hypothetical protein
MESNKTYQCADKNCTNLFKKFKSTDKYCSYTCAVNNTKPLKKTPLKSLGWRPEPISDKIKDKIDKHKNRLEVRKNKHVVKSEFEKAFVKARRLVIKRVFDKFGKLRCENCKTTRSIQFSTHHIVFRSERPKHPELNNPRNLVYLCYNCHESYHKQKNSRNHLVEERKLTELFGNIWGYDTP